MNQSLDASFSPDDKHWMQHAITLAAKGELLGEVPVGAVLVSGEKILGEGFNQVISAHDPTAHAEVVALRQAAEAIKNYRLINTRLYVTLEPCTMCVGALVHARVARVVFGTREPKAGTVVSQARLLDATYLNHRVIYQGGLLADQCQHQLSQFFAKRRLEK
jgi:tRNA(adenine34) deaminase